MAGMAAARLSLRAAELAFAGLSAAEEDIHLGSAMHNHTGQVTAH